MSTENVPALNDVLAAQVEVPMENKSLMAEVSSQNWVPALAICSALSDAAKKKIAYPGDFVLGGQTNLGTKIEVVCLDYRIHAAIISTDTYMPEHELFIGSDFKDSLKNHKEYCEIEKRPLTAKQEFVSGVDLFFFLPAQNSFCMMWYKKTLLQYADPTYRASLGGRLLEISTVLMENRNRSRSWFVTSVVPTKKAVMGSKLPDVTANIAVPAEMYQKYYGIFKTPKKSAVEATNEAVPNRER